mmetsp:Transcript_25901/g.78762  ORF Transcript_25901/g.78762 Transcript_25901/m.78762 type:complete len:100 (+) Transcript_25901:287-586(+)
MDCARQFRQRVLFDINHHGDQECQGAFERLQALQIQECRGDGLHSSGVDNHVDNQTPWNCSWQVQQPHARVIGHQRDLCTYQASPGEGKMSERRGASKK